MKFYKVKSKFDNYPLKARIIYVANELLTEKEVTKYNVNKDYCEIIDVPKNKTHWFFGARFANIEY